MTGVPYTRLCMAVKPTSPGATHISDNEVKGAKTGIQNRSDCTRRS